MFDKSTSFKALPISDTSEKLLQTLFVGVIKFQILYVLDRFYLQKKIVYSVGYNYVLT